MNDAPAQKIKQDLFRLFRLFRLHLPLFYLSYGIKYDKMLTVSWIGSLRMDLELG